MAAFPLEGDRNQACRMARSQRGIATSELQIQSGNTYLTTGRRFLKKRVVSGALDLGSLDKFGPALRIALEPVAIFARGGADNYAA